jgi:hypothetical protein
VPRFVILEHDHPRLHWDFMLEAGDVLKTWRLAAPPQAGPAVDAVPLPDHRHQYLDYEGPVSGNRGRVARWDAGEFVWRLHTEDRVEVQLAGRCVHGTAVLEKIAAAQWRLTLIEEASPEAAG